MNINAASILIVDDEPELLEIYSAWLEGAGCPEIRTAGNGEEALGLCRTRRFDLVISDVTMPRMDGATLLRHLLELGQPMPGMIFASGYDTAGHAELKALGAEVFLSKPVRRKEFLAAAENVLAGRERV